MRTGRYNIHPTGVFFFTRINPCSNNRSENDPKCKSIKQLNDKVKNIYIYYRFLTLKPIHSKSFKFRSCNIVLVYKHISCKGRRARIYPICRLHWVECNNAESPLLRTICTSVVMHKWSNQIQISTWSTATIVIKLPPSKSWAGKLI